MCNQFFISLSPTLLGASAISRRNIGTSQEPGDGVDFFVCASVINGVNLVALYLYVTVI
jgi:hypothetical protein